MVEDRITLIGISTLTGQIGPDGNHLRWSPPRDLGFPSKGFFIYRKNSGMGITRAVNISTLDFNDDPPREVDFDGFHALTSTGQLDLRFNQPVAKVQINLETSGSCQLAAYKERRFPWFPRPRYRLLTSLPINDSTVSLTCAGISRLTIGPGLQHVTSVSYATDDDACGSRMWQQIHQVLPPFSQQLALDRLESGIRNYYVADQNDAIGKYRDSADQVFLWLSRLFLQPAERQNFFQNPTAHSSQLKVHAVDEGGLSVTAPVQSAFLLAALDPNIARLMGLYWVDAFKKLKEVPTIGESPSPRSSNEEWNPPSPGELYDYKVDGDWGNGRERCGLLLGIGSLRNPSPSALDVLAGEQLPGVAWKNRDPLGRLGLSWSIPQDPDFHLRSVLPVLYELKRKHNERPYVLLDRVLIDHSPKRRPKPLYVDPKLRLGKYKYKIRPIDVFGQVGPETTSNEIEIKDLEGPPPPVRTKASLSHDNTRLSLQFEFGASQNQQAHDVKEFNIFWRPDTLFESREVVVEPLETTETVDGKFVHRVRLKRDEQTPIPQDELKQFVGDVLTNVRSSASHVLPANKRRRFRIASIDDFGGATLEAITSSSMLSGILELVRDQHNRSIWIKLAPPVDFQKPITGLLLEVSDGLKTQVTRVDPIEPSRNQFASLPAEYRGRQFPAMSPPESLLQIEISRLLSEPDVFVGGHVKLSNNERLKIKSVVSSSSPGMMRVLVVPGNSNVRRNDRITLLPPSELADRVKQLRLAGTIQQDLLKNAGGEIAFDRVVDNRPVTTTMRVISSPVKTSSSFDLLVRADSVADARALRINSTETRFYPPYVVRVPFTLNAQQPTPPGTNPTTISMPIIGDSGRRDGFVSVNAVDDRGNEGPLSAPAQFFTIRMKPLGAPSAPYPCALGKEAPAGYASPPDRAGRATTWVKWDADMINPLGGYRFEVARALDNSILVTHLHDWQTGKILEPASPVIAGANVLGNLSNVAFDDSSGLIKATFAPTNPLDDVAIFRNGRLRSGNKYFQVTLAQTGEAGTDLRLRGLRTSLPQEGMARLAAPPDYSQVKGDHNALRNLATQVPGAFSLVTGIPIDPVVETDPTGAEILVNRFRDEIPGRGRNAFFYRVRAVDAAENRSAWSPVSVPFHQVDTTPPEAPRDFVVFPGDRQAHLIWLRSPDPDITHFRIYRSAGDRETDSESALHSTVKVDTLAPRRLVAVAGSLTLPRPIEIMIPVGDKTKDVEPAVKSQVKVQLLAASPRAPNLFDPVAGGVIFEEVRESGKARITVRGISGLPPVDGPLKVTIGNQTIDGDYLRWSWIDQGLVGGQTYAYKVAALRTVRAAPQSGNQEFSEIVVAGKSSERLAMTAFDRSAPPAPEIRKAAWLNAQGALVNIPILATHVRLTLRTAAGTAWILIEERFGTSGPWTSAAYDGGRGWQQWQVGQKEVTVLIKPPNSLPLRQYRATVRTGDGRTSPPSDPRTLGG